MQANKRRDTKPELEIRRRLFAAGLRYRVDAAPLAGLRRRADVVFRSQSVAVFVDGCFWHGCPEHGPTKFGTNADFWERKIKTNRERDANTNSVLSDAGWTVLRFWEHEDPELVAREIVLVVKKSRSAD